MHSNPIAYKICVQLLGTILVQFQSVRTKPGRQTREFSRIHYLYAGIKNAYNQSRVHIASETPSPRTILRKEEILMKRRSLLAALILGTTALMSTFSHADALDDILKNKTRRVAVPQDFPPF